MLSILNMIAMVVGYVVLTAVAIYTLLSLKTTLTESFHKFQDDNLLKNLNKKEHEFDKWIRSTNLEARKAWWKKNVKFYHKYIANRFTKLNVPELPKNKDYNEELGV